LFAGIATIKKTVRRDYRMKLVTLLVRSDSSKFSRKEDRDNTMVIEGHRHAGRKRKVEKLAEMNKELTEIRADIENLNCGCSRKPSQDGYMNSHEEGKSKMANQGFDG
jgi:tRNA-dihydrouridine synthase